MLKLIALFTTGIPAFFALIVSHFGRKFSTITATFIALGIMLTTFIACVNVILQYVTTLIQLPNWLALGLGMAIPGNFAAIVSALVSARICRAAFDYMWAKADIAAKAS